MRQRDSHSLAEGTDRGYMQRHINISALWLPRLDFADPPRSCSLGAIFASAYEIGGLRCETLPRGDGRPV